MSSSFFERLPLSRYDLDRDYLLRERENLFDELFADPTTRVLVLMGGQALLAGPTTLALVKPNVVPDAEVLIYVGRTTVEADDAPAGTPIVAAVITDAGAVLDEFGAEGDWGDLRRLGSRLSDRDAGLFTEALAMANWHAANQFSPRTGEPTTPGKGGWVRVGPDGHELFPRTDSAIIVGITDAADRLLLGSNAMWESNRYSLLAGFVEPGESLETAVKREVFEEAGLRVIDTVYLGSQPWPFPASLMLGYTARVDPASDGLFTPDGNEILDLRWFSREELAASLNDIRLPGGTSIARAIIEEWFGGPIEDVHGW
jgi:NAD+ diphosphatase